MSYCINPQCNYRENPENLMQCQNCGASLVICDRYRLIKPLRQLSPAHPTEIFEVRDWHTCLNTWGTFKVLKVLKYNNNPELVRLFEQEARVLIFLRHPGIPKVEPDGYFTVALPNNSRRMRCLVMEKIEGETLADFINKNQTISCESALKWLRQLTEILQQLHRHDIVHRDIKPANIILAKNNRLVLIDFGTVGIDSWKATPVGSIGYAAPEQLSGKAVLQSDFFALGRTFVHLLTGISPMDFPTCAKTGKLLWQNKVNANIPQKLKELIDDLMAPLPQQRPENAASILQRIDTLLQHI
ncbi:MAG: protein kinase [Oscillatoriaceae bacterium SKW80]|nr:protein kinase [Oscillatoriaceae bacterium SKYG93]MCX8119368.1 protein kinase [Oscillatoriaceae bacterium SKW80]MDW8454835.1 protein kinase [Oscillatoriaceae cyanobacterium SKYGB_i_bin93]HIK28387.1 protein kinase [Oscillatoriaceae cyanobacterium M7585_C2015_266]